MARLNDCLNMNIAVDWDVKPHLNKPNSKTEIDGAG